ncbi:hypothetical protein BDR03DRAFT_1009834 [Suillus americanus]|nr:hypothetical protein BDR03DRAFT_1009834 [Suillus americanus]
MSFNANFPETPQSKANLQRIYREKEGEGFTELQQAIREVTDGKVDLAKRHETLTKGMSVYSDGIQLPNPHSAAQKIRELSRQNEELRRQLNRAPDSSWGAQGGQTHVAWPGTTAIPYATQSGFGAMGNNFSAAQYPAQYYPNNTAPSNTNFSRGYPGQGRGA